MKIDCSKSQLKNIGNKLRHNITLTELEEKTLDNFRSGNKYIIESFRDRHQSLRNSKKWTNHKIEFVTRLKKTQYTCQQIIL